MDKAESNGKVNRTVAEDLTAFEAQETCSCKEAVDRKRAEELARVFATPVEVEGCSRTLGEWLICLVGVYEIIARTMAEAGNTAHCIHNLIGSAKYASVMLGCWDAMPHELVCPENMIKPTDLIFEKLESIADQLARECSKMDP